jgi:hypothetical protein
MSSNNKDNKDNNNNNISFLQKIHEKIKLIDLFGTHYYFRVDNNYKYTTKVSNLISLIFFFFCFICFGCFTYEFIHRFNDLSIQILEKTTNYQLFTPENFHLSFKVDFKREDLFLEKNVDSFPKINDTISDKIKWAYFKKFENFKKQFEIIVEQVSETINGTNIIKSFDVHENCNEIRKNPNNFLNKIKDSTENHFCVAIKNSTLEGKYGDENFTYLRILFRFNKTYFIEEREKIEDFYLNSKLKINIFFSNIRYNYSNVENPVDKHLESVYSFADMFYIESTDIYFKNVVYEKDYNSFIPSSDKEEFINFNHFQKSFYPVSDRTILRKQDDKPVIFDDQLDLIRFNIKSERMSENITVRPKKILDYLSQLNSLISFILYFLKLTIPLYNQFEGKFTVMEKVFKINEEVFVLNDCHIKNIIKEFNSYEKNEQGRFNKKNDKTIEIPFPQAILEEIKDSNLIKNNNLNFNYVGINNNEKSFNNKSINLFSDYDYQDKIKENNNILIENSKLKLNSNKESTHTNNNSNSKDDLIKIKDQKNISNTNKSINSDNCFIELNKILVERKPNIVNEVIDDNNNKDDNILNNNNKEDNHKNFYKKYEIENESNCMKESNKKINKEKKKLESQKFFFERKYLQFFNCYSDTQQKYFINLTENIFNENTEIIRYQSMMNEFKLFKSLMNKDIYEIIKFISLPIVSLNDQIKEIPKKIYKKNFFELEKIGQILPNIIKENIIENKKDNINNVFNFYNKSFYSGIIDLFEKEIEYIYKTNKKYYASDKN